MSEPRPDESAQLRRRQQLAFYLPVLIGVLGRAVCWNRRPPDMGIFLEPWFNHIVHYGPIGAFRHPFSNYEPAYLYLLAVGSLAHGALAPMAIIKIISVAGTLFLTFALADLLKAAGAEAREALFVLILPSVVFNDALLAQCDALWAGSCVLGLAAMIRGRTARSMIWCGVAISFKAQAAFIAPVMIGAMLGRRAPWWQWFIPAGVFLASLVPAWLLGWPAIKLLTVYIGQAQVDHLAGRLANPWILGTIFDEQFARSLFVLGYSAAAAAAIILAALATGSSRDPRRLILLAALSGTALPFLLPKMLERYYFLGDIMTLALALSWKCRSSAFAVRAVQAASALSLITYIYFFYDPYPTLAGAVCAAAGLVAMCRLASPQVEGLVDWLRCEMWARGRGGSGELYRPTSLVGLTRARHRGNVAPSNTRSTNYSETPGRITAI
jgi:Gpi18-like mannosyltransferase